MRLMFAVLIGLAVAPPARGSAVDEAPVDLGGVATAAVPSGGYEIPVALLVVRRDDGSGTSTADEALWVVRSLNQAFSGNDGRSAVTPFRFVVKAVKLVRSTALHDVTRAHASDPAVLTAAAAARVGGFGTLNVFLVGPAWVEDDEGLLQPGDSAGAWAPSTPWQGAVATDFIVMHHDLSWSIGVITHEVGHWLGLGHTFADGCAGLGDAVADTPRHVLSSSNECGPADSCPDDPGQDPLDNFMGYTLCQDRFTPGQVERMTLIWQNWRSQDDGKADGGDDAMPAGSCSAAPGGQGGVPALLVVLGLALARRSRRA
jgi:hypothetical protein